ncbi:hypothetical protein J3E68DRAFT_398565 [Trichoderma sp. SZMC 28012]
MEHIAALSELQNILESLELVVWGEAAMANLGVPLIPYNIMLVPSEQNYSAVLEKVEQKGFCKTLWSYGSLDPADIDAHPQSERMRQIHATADQHYRMLNINSARYNFPPGAFQSFRLIILRPEYVDLSPPCLSSFERPSSCQAFTRQGIFLYPAVSTLIESFIKTALKDTDGKTWSKMLYVWITSYICVYLPVRSDAMDSCEDERIKEQFSRLITSDFATRWNRSNEL